MTVTGIDTMKSKRSLTVDGTPYAYYCLDAVTGGVSLLPFSLKVLLENLLRFEDDRTVTVDDIKALLAWTDTKSSTREIAYRPARVLMQDFTGVPAVARSGCDARCRGGARGVIPNASIH